MIPTVRNNQNRLPGIFGDLFDNDGFNIYKLFHSHTPAINVIESDKGYKVELAAPGMSKDDFKITINDNYLIVAMEKKEEKKQEDFVQGSLF